jgi:hypothetical protein
MRNKTLAMTVLTGTILLASGLTLAADQDRDQTRLQDPARDQIKDQTQDRTQDMIYGSQMMTDQERVEYRSRMRSAKTAQEREQIRAQHHESMKVRAKERGMTIADEPPAMGGGMGAGGGMRSGGGMGPGGKR